MVLVGHTVAVVVAVVANFRARTASVRHITHNVHGRHIPPNLDVGTIRANDIDLCVDALYVRRFDATFRIYSDYVISDINTLDIRIYVLDVTTVDIYSLDVTHLDVGREILYVWLLVGSTTYTRPGRS